MMQWRKMIWFMAMGFGFGGLSPVSGFEARFGFSGGSLVLNNGSCDGREESRSWKRLAFATIAFFARNRILFAGLSTAKRKK
jgi:hypothetical protein